MCMPLLMPIAVSQFVRELIKAHFVLTFRNIRNILYFVLQILIEYVKDMKI